MVFTKAELLALAATGAAQELKDIQQRVRKLHQAFPDIFATRTCPQLVKYTTKAGAPPEAAAPKPKPKRKWSAAQHRKFKATMLRKSMRHAS